MPLGPTRGISWASWGLPGVTHGYCSGFLGASGSRLARKLGVARFLSQRLNVTPRRLGVVEMMPRSRARSIANPDAIVGAMVRAGGTKRETNAHKEGAEQEHQRARGEGPWAGSALRFCHGGRVARWKASDAWKRLPRPLFQQQSASVCRRGRHWGQARCWCNWLGGFPTPRRACI